MDSLQLFFGRPIIRFICHFLLDFLAHPHRAEHCPIVRLHVVIVNAGLLKARIVNPKLWRGSGIWVTKSYSHEPIVTPTNWSVPTWSSCRCQFLRLFSVYSESRTPTTRKRNLKKPSMHSIFPTIFVYRIPFPPLRLSGDLPAPST